MYCEEEKNVIGHLKSSNCTDYPIAQKWTIDEEKPFNSKNNKKTARIESKIRE